MATVTVGSARRGIRGPRPRVSRRRCVIVRASSDPYLILGISRSASLKEIKAAYRSKARKMHPDVDRTPGAAQRFTELKDAYTLLSRATSDEGGSPRASYTSSSSYGASSSAYERWSNPGAKRQQEDDYSFDEFFRDVKSDWETMRKKGKDRRGGSAPKSLMEELADIGEELVDFLEQSAVEAERVSADEAKRRAGDAKSAAEEYRRAAEAARRDAAKAKEEAARQANARKNDVDDMLAQIKRDMGKL